MKPKTKATSFRLDAQTDAYIDKLAGALNMSRVQVVKTAVANMAVRTFPTKAAWEMFNVLGGKK